jgi:hypothetical protein
LDASYHACDASQGLLQLFFTFFLGSFPNARHHVCDIVGGMNILEIALESAGGVGRLAYILDLKQNVISNWRLRGSVPKGWETVLRIKFAKQIAAAEKVG